MNNKILNKVNTSTYSGNKEHLYGKISYKMQAFLQHFHHNEQFLDSHNLFSATLCTICNCRFTLFIAGGT
jgi:hypothetical protein